jgi:hypothetical protein
MGGGAARAFAGKLKKLIEAGFWYVKGNQGRDGLAEDSEYFNLPESWLNRGDSQITVNFECWPAFELFQKCTTQWRLSPMGDRMGLDYSAVIALAGVYGIADPETIDYIRNLELGAMVAYMGKDLGYILDGE